MRFEASPDCAAAALWTQTSRFQDLMSDRVSCVPLGMLDSNSRRKVELLVGAHKAATDRGAWQTACTAVFLWWAVETAREDGNCTVSYALRVCPPRLSKVAAWLIGHFGIVLQVVPFKPQTSEDVPLRPLMLKQSGQWKQSGEWERLGKDGKGFSSCARENFYHCAFLNGRVLVTGGKYKNKYVPERVVH